MENRLRLAVGILVLAVILVLGADWLVSKVRLGSVSMTGELVPPVVVADGDESTILVVTVTQDGRPRDNDLLQAWIETGGGVLIPEWVYTDEKGQVQINYTPNPMTKYDVDVQTVIHVADHAIGRLVEVSKHYTIEVPIEAPSS